MGAVATCASPDTVVRNPMADDDADTEDIVVDNPLEEGPGPRTGI